MLGRLWPTWLSHAVTGGARAGFARLSHAVTCKCCIGKSHIAEIELACISHLLPAGGFQAHTLSPCGQAPGHLLNACEQTTAERVFPVLKHCNAATTCIASQNACQKICIVCQCDPEFVKSWLMQRLFCQLHRSKSGLWANSGCSGAQPSNGGCQADYEADTSKLIAVVNELLTSAKQPMYGCAQHVLL
jgi:hypothetical protein